LSYRGGVVIATASELIFPRLPDMQRTFMGLVTKHVRDMLVITCLGGDGVGMCIGVLLKNPTPVSALERNRWSRIAAHLGAASRLRHLSHRLAPEAMPVEAVLDPAGKVHHAEGPAARARDLRDRLREVIRRIERTRTSAGRSDADRALDNWEGLVHGRWSMVDRFDADGRRFIVAVKNDPACPDPRGLTEIERQVAEWVGLGKSSTEIAYILGVSDAAVTNCTARAREKLGLGSRAELVAFFAQNGFRRKLAETVVANQTFLVGSCPMLNEQAMVGLTEAERSVVADLIAGSTNADIAHRRGVSERTVANQVQSAYRKLNVRSRAELVVRLQRLR
jgi:DNA-binding CsgD family transcriptional regulator